LHGCGRSKPQKITRNYSLWKDTDTVIAEDARKIVVGLKE